MPIYECMCLFTYMHLRQPLVILFGCKLLVVLSLRHKNVCLRGNQKAGSKTKQYGATYEHSRLWTWLGQVLILWEWDRPCVSNLLAFWCAGRRFQKLRRLNWNILESCGGWGAGPGGVVGARRGLLEHYRAGGGASSLSLRSHQLEQLGWLGGGKVHADLSSTREFIGNACKTLVQHS